MALITIENLGIVVEARRGFSLLTSLLYAEVPIRTRCGGRARCGCCRVRIIGAGRGLSPIGEAERLLLGDELVAGGWRLACQTTSLRDVTIYLPGDEELGGDCVKNKEYGM